MKAKISGGDLLARALAACEVAEVFTLHGGHLDSFLTACADAGIRLTDARHEASAGHAADGYARASGGRIGVCVTTAGPGFTNSLTAVANAYLDGVPVLFISGSPPLREAQTNPLQGGFDQVAMAAPVTKLAHRITNAERIADLVSHAVQIALTGRPGPVFLEIPIDVMFAPAEAGWQQVKPLQLPARPAPAADAIDAAMALLLTAERPVMIAGAGSVLSPASEPLLRFAERTGIPVAANSKAAGILPHDHPCHIGLTSTIGAANFAGHGPDVVILLGARMGMFTGGRSGGVIPHTAKVIQIDINGAEIGRLRAADIGIVADCSETMRAFADAADHHIWPGRDKWSAMLQDFRRVRGAAFLKAPKQPKPHAMHPFHAVSAVFEALRPDTLVISDGGEAGCWVQDQLKSAGPGRFMTCGYLGCLGVAPGFAIGAARACPDTPIVCFTGDGGAGFNIQEFDTMVRHAMPILTIVLNNACWGMSQNGQDLVFGANRRAAVALSDTNYDAVAAAFGGYGERVDRYEDVAPAVKRALASGKPACINLIIDADIVHPITVAMVGDVSAEDQISIPNYENIPLAAAEPLKSGG